MAGASLALHDAGFRYRTRRTPALRHVTLNVAPGETLAVLGPSGSGKSTLALCLNGLIPHHVAGELTGSVEVDGRDTRAADPAWVAETVGVVFQDPEAQLCQLVAEDEVAFGLENLGAPREEMRPRVEGALESVGLGGMGGVRVDRLSGGQKQRLALAAVLVMEPRVLVLDEPTAHLDPRSAREFFERVARLRGERTLIIVEHRVEHALPLADRVLVIGPDGAPVALGETRSVLAERWQELRTLGVPIPDVTEVALRRGGAGGGRERVPLTVDEAAETLADWRPAEPGARTAAAGASREVAVRVNGLTFRYPAGVMALRDARCSVPAGRLTAIVGPNGSGKTTLVAHLAGILRPARGIVEVLGRDGHHLARHPEPELVGFVFQNPEHQFMTSRVFDEVAWGLRLKRLPEGRVEAEVEAQLSRFGLTHLGGANPYTLSGGEKRRLSLATALVLRPRVLILDEPTFGQDARTGAALIADLEGLTAEGVTVIAVTHDMRLLASHAEHAILLVGGRVAFEGRPEALLSDGALVEEGRLELPPLIQLARRLGVRAEALA